MIFILEKTLILSKYHIVNEIPPSNFATILPQASAVIGNIRGQLERKKIFTSSLFDFNVSNVICFCQGLIFSTAHCIHKIYTLLFRVN